MYRRYAGLFFCVCVDPADNELAYLEAIHFFVEVLDTFFGNVCELDLVFNFYKVCLSLSGCWSRRLGARVVWGEMGRACAVLGRNELTPSCLRAGLRDPR